AQPGDCSSGGGGIGRAGAGDAGDGDVIDEAAGVLDDLRQAVVVAGRRREADEIEVGGAGRRGQLGVFLGRQVDDDDAVDPGGREARKEPGGGVGIGVARGQVGDEPGSSFLAQRRKSLLDSAHNLTPRWSATAKMSLSPRPHIFMTIRWSRGRVGAILATWAK